MNTILRFAFAMLAALSLASCSSDDEEEFLMDQLSGTWEQVYDEGVVAEGYVSTRLRLASRPQWVNVPFMCMMSLQATRHLCVTMH